MTRIWNKVVSIWDEDSQRYITDEAQSECFEHDGPTALCKGPTQEQKDLQAKQAAFYDEMTSAYSQQFQNQQAVMDSLKKVWQPVLDAGADQYGFTSSQDATLRTQASEGTQAAYTAAAKATQGAQAASGGGNAMLPSGVAKATKQNVAQAAANENISQQLGITNQGYGLGYQKFLAATDAMLKPSGIASQYNPLGYSQAATSAGSAEGVTANQIQQANDSWMGVLGGVAGSALGAAGSVWEGKCWVAAEVFGGWNDPRTNLVRAWMFTEYNKTFPGNVLAWLYGKIGKQVAWTMHHFVPLKRAISPLFKKALTRAITWAATVYSEKFVPE